MSHLIDMTGQVIGCLTVIGRVESQKKHTRWLCKCKCGNKTVVDAGNLRSGHTITCGHCQKYESLDENTMRCVLPTGDSFLFDTADFPFVSSHRWSIENSGYVHSMDKGKHIRLHSCLIGKPNMVVDHINGDRSDNRRSNLRLCTNKENVRNQRLSLRNTSGYKGVSYDHRRGKYSAQICVDYRTHFLGYFADPISAARKYDEAAIKYFGDYARLNFKGCCA